MVFIRNKENFTCRKCGKETIGDGYTDHCSYCLWSKHVDVDPGDRLANCGGLMKPIGVEVKSDRYTIYYQCQKCKYRHRIRAQENDDFEIILKLTKEPVIEDEKD